MNALPLASVPETEMVVSSGSTCWAVAVGVDAVCVADAAGGAVNALEHLGPLALS